MKRQRIFASLVVATVFATGICVAWAVLTSFLWSVGESLNPPTTRYERFGITIAGDPYIETSEIESPYRSVYRNLDGDKIARVNPYYVEHLMPPKLRKGTPAGYTWWYRVQTYAVAEPPENWFFVHDGDQDGHGYFVGFDQKSKGLRGYIGTNGLSPTLPDLDHQFSVPFDLLSSGFDAKGAISSSPSQSPTYEPQANTAYNTTSTKVHMILKDKVLEVDLNQRTVIELAEEPNAFAVGRTNRALASTLGDNNLQLVVRKRESIVLIGDKTHPRIEIPIPKEIQELPCSVVGLDQDELLLFGYKASTPTMDYNLYWVDGRGQVTRHRAVALNTGQVEVAPQLVWTGIGLAMPSPLPLSVLATFLNPQQDVLLEKADSYRQAVAMNWKQCWPIFLLITLGSLALAVIARRRHRQLGQDYSWVWFIFVLLFGAPGMFGYLFHRSWPVLEECPTCRQPVPHDRDRCLDCFAAFPQPSRLGTEIGRAHV